MSFYLVLPTFRCYSMTRSHWYSSIFPAQTHHIHTTHTHISHTPHTPHTHNTHTTHNSHTQLTHTPHTHTHLVNQESTSLFNAPACWDKGGSEFPRGLRQKLDSPCTWAPPQLAGSADACRSVCPSALSVRTGTRPWVRKLESCGVKSETDPCQLRARAGPRKGRTLQMGGWCFQHAGNLHTRLESCNKQFSAPRPRILKVYVEALAGLRHPDRLNNTWLSGCVLQMVPTVGWRAEGRGRSLQSSFNGPAEVTSSRWPPPTTPSPPSLHPTSRLRSCLPSPPTQRPELCRRHPRGLRLPSSSPTPTSRRQAEGPV